MICPFCGLWTDEPHVRLSDLDNLFNSCHTLDELYLTTQSNVVSVDKPSSCEWIDKILDDIEAERMGL